MRMPETARRPGCGILVQGFSRAKVEYFDESQAYLVAKVRPKAEIETVPGIG
jgi:hypothetical protein